MDKEKLKLSFIRLKGYKSINSDGQKIDFQDVTVFIGANGAGKSNLVSFFSMLNHMMTGALQTYLGKNGSADSFLYYGAKTTTRIEASLNFKSSKEQDVYKFILSHAVGDTLIFNEETLSWKQKNSTKPFKLTLAPGLKESGLYAKTRGKGANARTAQVMYSLLSNCRVFQFHDTSSTARIRNKGYINDNRFLRSDGGNLAAFLYMLKSQQEKYYNRIIRYVRQILPQFGDFELHPSPLNENYILLNWKEKKSDYLFGPHQISDGSLRFICLATLLLQPPELLPSVIILDEPELGLHPSAIAILAGMTKTASKHCQIVLATQSPRLVDEFNPDNIVVVERNIFEDCSRYKTLQESQLDAWLERYSLSELWEKNVLGGQA